MFAVSVLAKSGYKNTSNCSFDDFSKLGREVHASVIHWIVSVFFCGADGSNDSASNKAIYIVFAPFPRVTCVRPPV